MAVPDRPNEGHVSTEISRDRLPSVYNATNRFAHVLSNGQTVRQESYDTAENARIRGVLARRLYYAGQQYDDENAIVEAACRGRAPEHKRLHAYSTQIQECVDYLANRLGEGFQMKANASAVQAVVKVLTENTPALASLDENGDPEMVADDLIRDALIAGDVPVLVSWDGIENRPVWTFWESESVTFVMDTQDQPLAVIRSETVWEADLRGHDREVVEQTVYTLEPNPDTGVIEAVERVWVADETSPRRVAWLRIGRLPWALLRGDKKQIRSYRGEPLVTQQAMETADRYNAVEQTGYLISRYNSHSNVAVIGDAASLKLETDGRMSKDVADVISFPGGTSLQVLSLPTDTQMIEHQRDVLADALYANFGVTKSDPQTIQGMGQVSGYALEILNQKTAATYSRLARRLRRDLVDLLNLTLDVTAWKGGLGDDNSPPPVWYAVIPENEFPDRKVALKLGKGDVVDDARIRDDFVAKLISREEALRQRGYDPDVIKKIVGELESAEPKQEPAETGAYAFAQGLPGEPVQKAVPAGDVAQKTKAGDTLNSTSLPRSGR